MLLARPKNIVSLYADGLRRASDDLFLVTVAARRPEGDQH
jgi:hypothetical protein